MTDAGVGKGDDVLRTMESFSDADFKKTIWSALRLLGVITVVAAPLVWWKLGWQSAVLLLVGAVISGSGLFEWLRLMTAVMVRMDGGGKAKPMGLVLFGFFLRLGLTVVLLYVSLKFLNGSVYALAAGLALGVFALTVEGLRLMKAWTV
ncbi:ATP synthase subunit I [Granulicella sp. L60]|uniref:ATP synthase subunit I n=1 Tax=Granulicella sp. L60 TaxID=1641866 RepID=UPI0020B16BEB|nr:ATP synthase subunit I [Granulicella sp. L60]